MEREWYYYFNKSQHGAFTQKQIESMIANEELPTDVLLWKDKMLEWTPANKIFPKLENKKTDLTNIENLNDEILNIVKKRLALGEISIEEYQKLVHTLRCSKNATPIQEFKKDVPLLEIDSCNWFGHETLRYKNNTFNYEDITAIDYGFSTLTINLILSTHFLSFTVLMKTGEFLKYSTQSMLIKTNKYKVLSKALDHLLKATYKHRMKYYLDQFEEKGFIEYDGCIIRPSGDITKGTVTINISEAANNNNIVFGRRSSFGSKSFYTPDEITIKSTDNRNYESIAISLDYNKDIISEIITFFATSGGGKVKRIF